MKRTLISLLVVIAVLCGIVAWLDIREVQAGIIKHTPPCAPVTTQRLLAVLAVTGTGIALGLVASVKRPRQWLSLALLAIVLNVGAFSVWGYWLSTETLLPYEKWCAKVGMP
jgi:hypothetical protein